MENQIKHPEKKRKEIQPEDIWNKESYDKIKEHILNRAKKQTPEDRLKTELMAIQYQMEDYLKQDHVERKRNVIDFLKMYLKLMRITQKEFANIIDMRDTNLHKYLRGERKLNPDIVCKISSFSHTKPELWFFIETKNSILELKNDQKNMEKYNKYGYENYLFKTQEEY